jgi:KDO2-lipid IV(A) lauroyltransferase
MSGCETFFLDLHREAGVYHMSFVPMPSGYPFSDEVRNATELNNLIESALTKYPEQYMWMHRRFKTNPDQTRHTFY